MSLRKFGVTAFALLAGCFAFVPSVFAQQIIEFGSTVLLHKDGTVSITETIDYDFGNLERHGIYRDIPTSFTDAGGTVHSMGISVSSVVDENGNPYHYDVSRSGDATHIQIGDADTTITGTHRYVIRYDATDVVAFLSDRDEIYWNVTGNDWNLLIGRAFATVTVPYIGDAKNLAYACYQGVRGSDTRCGVASGASEAGTVSFVSNGSLTSEEGMTIAVGFPKGNITESTWQRFRRLFLGRLDLALGILIPLIIGFFASRAWYLHGRDPKGRGTIIPEYEAPDTVSVLESALLLRNTIRASDISAAIVALAVKRAIRIEEKVEKSLLVFTKREYTLVREPHLDDLLPIEESLMKRLFKPEVGADGDRLELSHVKQRELVGQLTTLKEMAGTELARKKLFTKNPYKSRGWILAASVMVPVTGLIAGINLNLPWTLVGSLAAGLICAVFSYLMPQKTKEGVALRESLLGLRRYISVAEKNRIEFHDAPEKSPQVFEKLLPYAMLFGVTEIWTKEFADIMKEPPAWYSSSSGAVWSANAFAGDLSNFGNTITGVASPNSSGSGGGGFSGGGGGGGGGGSW